MLRVLLCGLLCASHALVVNTPTSLAGHFPSPISQRQVGNQNPDLNITGFAVYVEFGDCLAEGFDRAAVDGKVVLLRNQGEINSIVDHERNDRCLQNAGALVVVQVEGTVLEPGVRYYWNDRDLKHDIGIAEVQVVYTQFKSVCDAVAKGQQVSITVLADTNLWRTTYFDSLAFFVIMRVAMCFINIIGVLISIDSALSHLSRLIFDYELSNSNPVRGSVTIMAGGSVFVLIGCLIRAVYCAIGPAFSTDRLDYVDHSYLVFVSYGIDMLPTLMAVSLFLRWGAFGEVTNWFKRHLEVLLVFAGVAFFILSLVLAAVSASFISNLVFVVLFASVFGFVCLTASSVVFLVAGSRFIKQLHLLSSMTSANQARTKFLRKAVRYITLSGICHCLQILGALMSTVPIIQWTPQGHFAIDCFMFFGMTLSSISQVLAFRPSTDVHPAISTKIYNKIRRSWLFPPRVVIEHLDTQMEVTSREAKASMPDSSKSEAALL